MPPAAVWLMKQNNVTHGGLGHFLGIQARTDPRLGWPATGFCTDAQYALNIEYVVQSISAQSPIGIDHDS